MVLISGIYTSVILEPGEEPFNLPSPAIASERPPILCFGSLPVGFVRRDHLNPYHGHFLVQWVAVIGLVTYHFFGKLNQKTTFDGLVNQPHFMRRSAVHVEGVRKTRTVCNCHDLRAFTPLSFPNPQTPFFAGTKVPSIKASRRSIPPRSRRSSASASKISSNTPSLDHFWCQRWQVDLGGYRSGRSCHWAPVRRIQRIPLSTSRGSRRDRPRGSVRVDGIRGSIRVHCSSVKSIWIYKTRFSQMSRIYFGMTSSKLVDKRLEW